MTDIFMYHPFHPTLNNLKFRMTLKSVTAKPTLKSMVERAGSYNIYVVLDVLSVHMSMIVIVIIVIVIYKNSIARKRFRISIQMSHSPTEIAPP